MPRSRLKSASDRRRAFEKEGAPKGIEPTTPSPPPPGPATLSEYYPATQMQHLICEVGPAWVAGFLGSKIAVERALAELSGRLGRCQRNLAADLARFSGTQRPTWHFCRIRFQFRCWCGCWFLLFVSISTSVSVSLLVSDFCFVVSSLGFDFSFGFGFAAGFGFWFRFQLLFWLRCLLRLLVSV